MDFLLNTLVASIIISIVSLIIIHYLLSEYEIESREYTKIFLYMLFFNTLMMTFYKKLIIKKHGYEPITAAAEVFNEIKDSQQLNGIMNIMGGIDDDLIIDNIPNSITCNNIV